MKNNSLVFLFFVLFFAPSFVQVQEQQPFRIEVRNVYLPVLAFDKDRTVALAKENFRIFEGEKRPDGKIVWTEQNIQSFARYEDQPLALAVAVDSSGSMAPLFENGFILQGDKLEQAKNAARVLFRSVFREGKDTGLVSEIFYELKYIRLDSLKESLPSVPNSQQREFFYKQTYSYYVNADKNWARVTSNLFIDQDWTKNLSEIEKGINQIKTSAGLTPLRDASFNLSRHFLLNSGDFLRVAVIITDGLDTPDAANERKLKFSIHSLVEAVAEFQNNQVLVYAVGLYNKSLFGSGQPTDFLEKLTKETGGLAFFETNLSKLTDIFQRIGSTIRNANFLGYEPVSNQEGERQIKVEIGEWDAKGKWHKKNYTMFHRKGYFYKK